ncbi:unnamed protein product [Protopolystoma xenopodis]|uniref:Uncharacterized protein n=1 Tax=Protopolystoma xenopodis TaxID=117903 RepID=A0A448WTZ5_9PLAT|nr:unnamed protein product [Protopolystoma xenopodis]
MPFCFTTVAAGPSGVQNNTIEVKASDFDVLAALSHDIANSKTSGSTTGSRSEAPSTPSRVPASPAIPVPIPGSTSCSPGHGGGGSPPGEYGRVIPANPLGDLATIGSDAKKTTTPPLLPPQLLQFLYLHIPVFHLHTLLHGMS